MYNFVHNSHIPILYSKEWRINTFVNLDIGTSACPEQSYPNTLKIAFDYNIYIYTNISNIYNVYKYISHSLQGK